MRRKQGREGGRDEESEKMKNEKVAKGRIIGLAGPCFLMQHGLNHLQPVKAHFTSILAKALPTDQRTDRPTNRPTDKASFRDAKTHLKREEKKET